MGTKLAGTYRDSLGNAVAEGTITVHDAGTSTLAEIFSDAALSAAEDNPLTGDDDGRFAFFVAPGAYKATAAKSGFDSWTEDYIVAAPLPTVFNVKDYGAVGDNSTDDTAAIQAAIDAAEAIGGGVVYVPPSASQYKVTSDLVVDGENVTIRGAGWRSWLNLNGCRLHVDGSAEQLSGFAIEDLRIRRFGTAGVALDMLGAGSNTGPTRFAIRRVEIQGGSGAAGSRNGTCIRLAGCNLGVIEQVFLHDSQNGILVELDPVSAAFSAPQVTMVGGDITDCDNGIVGTNLRGWQMLGVTIQFCDTIGMDILGECRGIDFHGCRFETNANFDLRVGSTASGTTGLSMTGCYLTTATSHGITLIRAQGCVFTGNRFFGYTAEAIDIQEASAGAVTGYSDGNVAPNGVVATNGCRGWGRTSDVFVGRGNPAAGATQFGSPIAVESSGENPCTVPAPFAGFARSLMAEKTNAAGTGESLTVTFRVQNADTALTAAISGASATTAENVTNVATFTRGQRLALEFTATNNGSYTATQTRASVELVRLD